jgi:hypothetical protein
VQFGLTNAVFAIGDTFLEVVSPIEPDVPGARTAVRRLERSGGSVCGYMVMLQVDDLPAARERARAAGVREVFGVELDDINEVHLHPGDMRGAIVSLSVPEPEGSWRWGGAGWSERTVPGGVTGVTVAVADPDAVAARWAAVAGGPVPGCSFVADDRSAGWSRSSCASAGLSGRSGRLRSEQPTGSSCAGSSVLRTCSKTLGGRRTYGEGTRRPRDLRRRHAEGAGPREKARGGRGT